MSLTRFYIVLACSALVVGAIGLATPQPTHAQQGGPSVCLTLPPGDHTFTAPARDREGEVSFQVTIAEGGIVTAFTEPGGQSIPPATVLQVFTGEDAYPLPDGIMIVECDAAAGGGAMQDAEDSTVATCLNLPPGAHQAMVSAGGRSYDLALDIGGGGRIRGIEILGQSYTAQEALELLQGFGATLPVSMEIVDCAASPSYANTGTGGLADTHDYWGALFTVGASALILLTAGFLRQWALRSERARD